MRVGMDLDGVLHNYNEAFVESVQRRFGVQLHPSNCWSSFSDQLKALGREDVWDFMWSGGVVDFFLGRPYDGAMEACREIDAMADLVLVTSRPPYTRTATYWWLAEHGVPTSEVHLVQGRKSAVQCDLYVDDALHNVWDLLENTPSRVVLWDQPWNQGRVSSDRCVRAREWQEVIDQVRSMR